MPDSLVARVFRAKYCIDGDFLRASAKAGCSYVWRSIMGSKDVIEKGARWRVGDGQKIRIFKDRWVDSVHSGLVRGKMEMGDMELRVSHLLHDSGEWRDDVLGNLFLPQEVAEIKQVSVGKHGSNDRLRWIHEPLGNFSVKTAYLQNVGFFELDEGTSMEDKKFWHKIIWSTSIPPKAKIMIWKACNNFLATGGNLRLHHVPVDGICKLCHDRWDSTEHALFFCPRIKRGWKNSRFWSFLRRVEMMDFVSIASIIHCEFKEEEFDLWCIMVWKTWQLVCNLTHENNEESGEVTEAGGWAIWEAYRKAKATRGRPDALGVKLGEKIWKKPKPGSFRVDVDAAFNPEENKYGVGVIVRDSDGTIAVAVARKSPPRSSVALAEVMAVVSGIVVCIEFEKYPVEIFTDSILVARIMAKRGEEEEFLPDDIAEMLNMARDNFLLDVKHMYRTANRAAHLLARFASTIESDMIWTEMYPTWLREVIEEEKS